MTSNTNTVAMVTKVSIWLAVDSGTSTATNEETEVWPTSQPVPELVSGLTSQLMFPEWFLNWFTKAAFPPNNSHKGPALLHIPLPLIRCCILLCLWFVDVPSSPGFQNKQQLAVLTQQIVSWFLRFQRCCPLVPSPTWKMCQELNWTAWWKRG